MYCPQCGGEYRDGFFKCADCGVALVDEPPAPAAEPTFSKLVSVLATADPARIAFVESLFLEEKIPYFKRGESLQDLFGMGRIGVNPVTGPVLIQVPQEYAEAASEILEALPAEDGGDARPSSGPE